MTGPRPGSVDAGQAVEAGGVGWGWETSPKGGWWWWWSTTRRSMGRIAVAAVGTCMGSAAVLTSTEREQQTSQEGVTHLLCKDKRHNQRTHTHTQTQPSLLANNKKNISRRFKELQHACSVILLLHFTYYI